jgi:hypothetical protein
MTRLLHMLISAMLLPLLLFAQDNGSSAQKGQAKTPESIQTGVLVPAAAQAVSSEFRTHGGSIASEVPQGQSQSQQKPKPSKPSPGSTESGKAPIEGSMVGYIDNAIVGSQIRLRFDIGFDNNRPDRAEFFYAQCGCNGGNAPGPKPGLVTNLNFQQLYMRAEYAPVRRFSAFFELPVRWVQPQTFAPGTTPGFPDQAGLSDVQAGLKFAALATHERYLTFQFLADFPSGDSSKGLGTNHYSIGPSLLFFQKVTDRFSIEAQVGDWHPIGGSSAVVNGATRGFAGDVFNYGFGPSYELYRSERVRVAPVIEIVGWSVLGGLETNGDLINTLSGPIVHSDGTNIVNVKIGVRTSIGDHNSFYVGYGQAVTHELWYKHIVRLEYRYAF